MSQKLYQFMFFIRASLRFILYSFYSSAFYREVGQHWRGLGIRYILVVLALSWLLSLFYWANTLYSIDLSNPQNNSLSDRSDPLNQDEEIEESPSDFWSTILAQLPVMTVQNGVLSISEKEPYVIMEPGTNIPFLVINTSKAPLPQEVEKATVLIMDREILIRPSYTGEVRYRLEEELGKTAPLIIDQAALQRLFEHFRPVLLGAAFLMMPLALMVTLFYFMLHALINAGIGMIFSKIIQVPLSFQALVRLAVVARTPIIFMETLLVFLPSWIIPSSLGLIYFIVSIGYLFFGIYANKGAKPAV